MEVEVLYLPGKGTAQEKLAVMEECGIKVTKNPADMGKLLKSVI